MSYDQVSPKNVINKLKLARRKLGDYNQELKKYGKRYAEARSEYKSTIAKRKAEIYNDGESAAGADTIASGEVEQLIEDYESNKVLWETQKEVCRHMAKQLMALQTIYKSVKEEEKSYNYGE